jgi:hypothetical protein
MNKYKAISSYVQLYKLAMLSILISSLLASPFLDKSYYCPKGERRAFATSNCYADPQQPTPSGSQPYRNRIENIENSITAIKNSILDHSAVAMPGCTYCSKSLAHQYFGNNLKQWEKVVYGLHRALNILDFYYPIDPHGNEKVFDKLGDQHMATNDRNALARSQFDSLSAEINVMIFAQNNLTDIFNSIKDLKDSLQIYKVDYETWCKDTGIDLVYGSPIYSDPIGLPASVYFVCQFRLLQF